MQKIKPAFVKFEQAKLFKEKGLYFPLSSDRYYWTLNGERIAPYNWFIPEELSNHVDALEQWQVVEWFRVEHSIWISIKVAYSNRIINGYRALVFSEKLGECFDSIKYDTPQEAYTAAFDYVLNNLI